MGCCRQSSVVTSEDDRRQRRQNCKDAIEAAKKTRVEPFAKQRHAGAEHAEKKRRIERRLEELSVTYDDSSAQDWLSEAIQDPVESGPPRG